MCEYDVKSNKFLKFTIGKPTISSAEKERDDTTSYFLLFFFKYNTATIALIKNT